MLLKKLVGVALVLLVAAPVFGREGRRKWRRDAATPGGGNLQGPTGAGSVNGGNQPSKLDQLSRGGMWLYLRTFPKKYELLDLTEEQREAIERLIKEAKEAFQESNREMQRVFRETRDASVFKDRAKRTEELKETYETRILDILTEEQRELLDELEKLAAEQQKAIAKVYEEANARVQKVREAWDKKLDKLLTPEQRARLEELLKPRRPEGGPLGGNPPGEVDIVF